MAKSRPRYINPPANATGNLEIDDLNSLLESLWNLDDRGLVLALAAFAEDTLGMLLVAYLGDTKQAKDLIVNFSAPLGSFSTRIKAAFAIGLLHREQYDDLELLREIRNAFAHDWQGVSFERDQIKSFVRSMHAKVLLGLDSGGDERNRVQAGMSTILIELRTKLKHMKKNKVQIPDISFRMTDQPPTEVTLVEVDELPPPR